MAISLNGVQWLCPITAHIEGGNEVALDVVNLAKCVMCICTLVWSKYSGSILP